MSFVLNNLPFNSKEIEDYIIEIGSAPNADHQWIDHFYNNIGDTMFATFKDSEIQTVDCQILKEIEKEYAYNIFGWKRIMIKIKSFERQFPAMYLYPQGSLFISFSKKVGDTIENIRLDVVNLELTKVGYEDSSKFSDIVDGEKLYEIVKNTQPQKELFEYRNKSICFCDDLQGGLVIRAEISEALTPKGLPLKSRNGLKYCLRKISIFYESINLED